MFYTVNIYKEILTHDLVCDTVPLSIYGLISFPVLLFQGNILP